VAGFIPPVRSLPDETGFFDQVAVLRALQNDPRLEFLQEDS
jgi:hypothetical protein